MQAETRMNCCVVAVSNGHIIDSQIKLRWRVVGLVRVALGLSGFMKTLLLVRHAKTAPAGPKQTDHARALEDSGVTDAGKLAHYLRKKDLVPDQILVSSANRTQTTTQILMTAFEGRDVDVVVSDELYLADASFLEKVIAGVSDTVDTLMIVGHNPGLSELAYQFDRHIEGLHPAQMLRVEFDVKHWVKASHKHVVKTRLI